MLVQNISAAVLSDRGIRCFVKVKIWWFLQGKPGVLGVNISYYLIVYIIEIHISSSQGTSAIMQTYNLLITPISNLKVSEPNFSSDTAFQKGEFTFICPIYSIMSLWLALSKRCTGNRGTTSKLMINNQTHGFPLARPRRVMGFW